MSGLLKSMRVKPKQQPRHHTPGRASDPYEIQAALHRIVRDAIVRFHERAR